MFQGILMCAIPCAHSGQFLPMYSDERLQRVILKQACCQGASPFTIASVSLLCSCQNWVLASSAGSISMMVLSGAKGACAAFMSASVSGAPALPAMMTWRMWPAIIY